MNRGGSSRTCRSSADLIFRTLFRTSLVLVGVPMMCWTPLTCAAAAAALPPSSSSVVVSGGERAVNRTTVRCLPVAHDVLWKRLRLVVADFDRFRTTDVNFRTTDVNDKFSLDVRHLVASANNTNDTSEPQAPSAVRVDDGPVHRRTTSSTAVLSTTVKLPDNPAETLPLEESNRIPDDATPSPNGGDPHVLHEDLALHPRLDPRRQRRLLKERKVRGLRQRRRLRRRRKLLTSIFRKTSWHCHMTKYWKRMPSGIFPAYVQTARCRQRTCMLGMFECRPRRYRIKLLRRNDGVCSPLPTTMATETDYEETWTFVEYKVVVGCECSKKYEAGSYSRHDDRRNTVSRNVEDGASNNS